MKSWWWCVTATAAVVLALQCCVTTFAEAECLYWFVEQPPSQLSCDPFNPLGTSFILPCTVLVNTASAQKGVSVEWYYEQDHFGEKYLLARIKFPPIETSQIQNNITALATWLEVRNEDVGFYYCQAVVEGEGAEGDREELQSNKLLVDVTSYSNLNQCSHLEPVTSTLPATCATNQSDTQPSGSSITSYTTNYKPITVQAEIREIARFISQPSVVSVLALVEGCVYQYTGEPPSELQCDPYSGGGQPTFECSVLVNTLVSAPTQLFQVVWYYEEEVANSGPVKLITFPFTEGEQEGGGGGGGEGGGAGGGGGGGGGGRVITQLTVENVQPGYYYCSIQAGGESFMPSTKTQWSAPGSYADLPPCSTDGKDYVLKVHSTRCANEVPTPNSYQFVTESTSSTKDDTVDIQTLLTQFLPPIGTENTTHQPVPSPTDQGTASTGPSLWVFIVPVVVVIVLIALGIGMLTLIIWRTRRAKLMRGTQTEATRQPVNRATRSESGKDSLLPPRAIPANSTSYPSLPHSGIATTSCINECSLVPTTTQEEHYYSRPQWPRISSTHSSSTLASHIYEAANSLTRTYSYPENKYFLAMDVQADCTHSGSYEVANEESYADGSYVSHSEIERGWSGRGSLSDGCEQQGSHYDKLMASGDSNGSTTDTSPYLLLASGNHYTGLNLKHMDTCSPHCYTSLGVKEKQSILTATLLEREYDIIEPSSKPGNHNNTNPPLPKPPISSPSSSDARTRGRGSKPAGGKGRAVNKLAVQSPHLQHTYINTHAKKTALVVLPKKPHSCHPPVEDGESKTGGMGEEPRKSKYQGLVSRDYATSYATVTGQGAVRIGEDVMTITSKGNKSFTAASPYTSWDTTTT